MHFSLTTQIKSQVISFPTSPSCNIGLTSHFMNKRILDNEKRFSWTYSHFASQIQSLKSMIGLADVVIMKLSWKSNGHNRETFKLFAQLSIIGQNHCSIMLTSGNTWAMSRMFLKETALLLVVQYSLKNVHYWTVFFFFLTKQGKVKLLNCIPPFNFLEPPLLEYKLLNEKSMDFWLSCVNSLSC